MTLHYVALVSVLILAQYIYFIALAGQARDKEGIKAPAMTGGVRFERALRVQLNTLEQMVLALPALWLCATFFRPDVAAGLGVVYLIGRFLYARGYLSDEPLRRGPGMLITGLASVAMLLLTLFGVIRDLM